MFWPNKKWSTYFANLCESIETMESTQLFLSRSWIVQSLLIVVWKWKWSWRWGWLAPNWFFDIWTFSISKTAHTLNVSTSTAWYLMVNAHRRLFTISDGRQEKLRSKWTALIVVHVKSERINSNCSIEYVRRILEPGTNLLWVYIH